MALEFQLRDFAFPASLVKLRRTLERTQYASPSELRAYQSRKLERVLDVAFRDVAHYRRQLEVLGLTRRDFSGPDDLSKLPLLEKREVADAARFVAMGAARDRSRWVTTSGSSGTQLRLLMDKPSNVLEFVYYWRHWSWAGYRLGQPFAELSTVAFAKEPGNHRHQRLLGRLLLNSTQLSTEIVRAHWQSIEDIRPKFLKGLASVLYHFASFVKRAGLRPHRFVAVFSTGETLLAFQRSLVEEVFDCKVYDSYGQMERLVAISECPSGRMHVCTDYGHLEIDRSVGTTARGVDGSAAGPTGGVIGTTLYNLSMPLLRYRIGDVVELPVAPEPCPCGRTLPTVARIAGRQSEVVSTPDGRIVTALFLFFEGLSAVRCGRIVQDEPGRLRIRVVAEPSFDENARAALLDRACGWFGDEMSVALELCTEHELLPSDGKKQPMR